MNIEKRITLYNQHDCMDCGPACLRMIAKYYGKSLTLQFLRERCYIDREGVSLKGISEAAEYIGLRSLAVKIPFNPGISDSPALMNAPLPAILHWNQNHFIVLYKLSKRYAWIADPAAQKIKIPVDRMQEHWISDDHQGIALLLEPSSSWNHQGQEDRKNASLLAFIADYVQPHWQLIIQLLLGLLATVLFSVSMPFLTQSIVDSGIDVKDLNFIKIAIAGQFMLFFGQTIVQFIENWIFLHISTRINISLIGDFLSKLMRLPLSFFESKYTGDIMQRINDQRRIENFLTQQVFSMVSAITSIIVFGALLAYYSVQIFLFFIASIGLYFLWIILFLKKRKEIDYLSFQRMSENQNNLMEIVHGIREIKLQGSQILRLWQWGTMQAKLFRIQIKSLMLAQAQDAGASGINQFRDILITFFTASAVITGELTLGMMLAIQYIIGRLTGPALQLVGFIRSAQDASISLERINEVKSHAEEQTDLETKMSSIPSGDLVIRNLAFRYTPISEDVLVDINLIIPRGKVTAIVGASGSGKTTLMKLLLTFYPPSKGDIKLDNASLQYIDLKVWRDACGVVMQDGYIFSDTIARNIAEGE